MEEAQQMQQQQQQQPAETTIGGRPWQEVLNGSGEVQAQADMAVARSNVNCIIEMWWNDEVEEIYRFMEKLEYQTRDRMSIISQGLAIPDELVALLNDVNCDLDAESGWFRASGGGADPRKDRHNTLAKVKKTLKEAGLAAAIGELEVATPSNKKDQRKWNEFYMAVPDILKKAIEVTSNTEVKQTLRDLIADFGTQTADVEASWGEV